MFEADQGLSYSYWSTPFDWHGPYHRANWKTDLRNAPHFGGGRRMRHPYFAPIVYPRNPDRTSGFDNDALHKSDTVLTKTLDSSVVTKFIDKDEDRVITEIWQAESLSTTIELARQFHRYFTTVLPVGDFIGWQPKDRTWKNYFIEMLSVQVGPVEDFLFEELGDERPYLMREQLTVRFKLVREIIPAVSTMVATGF